MNKLYFVVEDDSVSFVDHDNPRVPKLSIGFDRTTFFNDMAWTLPDNININYEPYHDIYIVTEDGIPEYFTDPQTDGYLKFIDDNIDAIRHKAEQSAMPNRVLIDGSWVLPQEVKDRLDLEAEVANLKGQLMNQNVWLFRMVLELWEVGKLKSGWQTVDVDPDVLSQAQSWISKIDRLKEIDK